MKFLPVFLLFFFSLTANAQQDRFLELPKEGIESKLFSSTFAEIFIDPGHWTSLTIDAEELVNAPNFDFSTLTNVETIEIKFTISPTSSEAVKQEFRDSINVLMKNVSAFSKCPKLDKILFCIGEQIYFDNGPKVKDGYSGLFGFRANENIIGAWRTFGKNISVELPNVKLYAYNWGW